MTEANTVTTKTKSRLRTKHSTTDICIYVCIYNKYRYLHVLYRIRGSVRRPPIYPLAANVHSVVQITIWTENSATGCRPIDRTNDSTPHTCMYVCSYAHEWVAFWLCMRKIYFCTLLLLCVAQHTGGLWIMLLFSYEYRPLHCVSFIWNAW